MVGKTHKIKCLSEYFDAVWSGRKTFELRKNDRDYTVDDIVWLREEKDGKLTGRVAIVKINYLLKDVPQYGLENGYCIFSWENMIQHVEC